VTRRTFFGGLSAEMVSNRKSAALDNGFKLTSPLKKSKKRVASYFGINYSQTRHNSIDL
jgi:hypothetical protein